MKRHPILFTALLSFAVSISCFAFTSQLLYVQHGQNLITYSVNPVTAAATKLGSLTLESAPARAVQVLHAPASPYVYVIGFTSATDEFIWVYATTSKGVPIPGSVQKLQVKPALTQFIFQANGKFAYALYSWSDPNPTFFGDIVLFTVNPKTGILTNTRKPVVNFPPDDLGYRTIYGLNDKGTKLYILYSYFPPEEGVGRTYYYSTINPSTGLLGKPIPFWGDDAEADAGEISDFSDSLIAQAFSDDFGGPVGIDIYTNKVYSSKPTPLIACTSKMLPVCADSATVKFGPSGKNLFITDNTINSVEIAAVKVKSLAATDSIPGIPSTLAFSPNGKIVYAQEGNQVLIYIFDPATGLLGAKSSITVPSKFAYIIPASQ